MSTPTNPLHKILNITSEKTLDTNPANVGEPMANYNKAAKRILKVSFKKLESFVEEGLSAEEIAERVANSEVWDKVSTTDHLRLVEAIKWKVVRLKELNKNKANNIKKNTDIEKTFVKDTIQGIERAYDTTSFFDDVPDYQAIASALYVTPYDEKGRHIGLHGAQVSIHNEHLDPTDKNFTVGTMECSDYNICVPNINVPSGTRALTEDLSVTTVNGQTVTNDDRKTAEEVKGIASKIAELSDYQLPEWITTEDLIPNPDTLAPQVDLSQYAQLATNALAQLTTQDSVPCRPETEPVIPEGFATSLENSPDLQDILRQLDDLLKENVEPLDEVKPTELSLVTTRDIDGHGAFDWLSKAVLNQVEYGINRQLWTKAEGREIYAQSLQASMQHAVQFALSQEQSKWQALAIKNQMVQANVQSLLAKAQLIMMPTQVKLAYAQLQAQMKQLDVMAYQIEMEKQKIPQMVAQTDQIREQTAVICQQRKMAVEQLAQAEFDRKLKQEQAITAQLDNQIKAEQITQAKQQSKQSVAQTEQIVEQTKVIHTQGLNGLKDLKMKDAQLLQMEAQVKLQAQQLLKEKEQVHLVKAQVASAYANITALAESIKAAKAQYSDTIDGQEIGGVLGAQINVNKAQAVGFERKAFSDLLSQLQSGWTAKKTADIATISPNSFTALGVDRVVNWYAQKYFNMPNDIFDLPEYYSDYLNDAQMDGKEPSGINRDAFIRGEGTTPIIESNGSAEGDDF